MDLYIQIIPAIVVFISLIIASFTDIKERIVPDPLSYSLIALGIIYAIFLSFFLSNFSFLINAAISCIAAFVFGYILWKIGLWGGGDVKLITGIAAFIPFNVAVLIPYTGIIYPTLNLPIFFITLFLFSIFSMLPYGIILIIYKFLIKPQTRKRIIEEKKERFYPWLSKLPINIIRGTVVFILLHLAGFYNVVYSLGLPLVDYLIVIIFWMILGRIEEQIKSKITLPVFEVTYLLVFAYVTFINFNLSVNLLITWFFMYLAIFLILELIHFLRKQSSLLLRTKIPVEDLEEGMISSKSLYLIENKVVEHSSLDIKTIASKIQSGIPLNKIMQPPTGEEIANSRAAGLTQDQVDKIKDLASQGLLPKTFETKDSAAMVPSILIAFLVLMLIGDMFWYIFIL